MRIDFSEYAHLCSEWHSGQASMMYAVASTGGLELGRIKPLDVESDEDWMLKLLNSLEYEIRICKKICEDKPEEYANDFFFLTEFHQKVLMEIENASQSN